MTRSFRLYFVPLCLVAGLLAPIAPATTIRAFSDAELVQASDLIVRATVESSRSFWNAGRSRIYTETTVAVSHVFFEAASSRQSKDKPRDRILIRQLGGRSGETVMTVPGTASLAARADVVLFLRHHETFFTLVGMAQGRIMLSSSPRGVIASSELEGADLLDASARADRTHKDETPFSGFWATARLRLEALVTLRLESEVVP